MIIVYVLCGLLGFVSAACGYGWFDGPYGVALNFFGALIINEVYRGCSS